MSLTIPDFREVLARRRLLAIVRGSDANAALRTVITLANEGVRLIEVSLVTTDALQVIRDARAELGGAAVLGAGTVISAGDARAAADAGASYLVTPAVSEAVRAGRELELPVLAGALTPTEVVAALDAGAAAVKLFPASFGGAGYLRALRDPFPQVPFVPVGGVGAAEARDYLAAGALAVGVGSPLVGDAARGGSLDELARRIAAFLTALDLREAQ
ncbi:bifunctional 4-hydroxy-2-oxoglutarate aldolase/2-dehydro-3-deoxy-phosphogluconate aldolase [Nonomuraea terrae]|uniref:Bifunctional 4-hydroxy-2-oxoglutarate aldolase/2-dehydro-3-deoxy-phosphogluconate aldolase n=1 Tax=Nonomuraea terrae TaxID=2530383 RepID=A0A4V2YHI1_9ACTN|nr:bifunctional 4-hydroxy-2-oxoglutarate aldolase/2-dehydro-3-deoxy-phosphogluconate aldolase [Nonomuraea terrae]TDD30997.1 bifunctional 4-hydroxy-2-oxoglutarate aldolase/2-dehydro-3-deoxy-phosphogluconate aldolase [Nonomuraea terrae]